jgi:hypothetical protein
LPPSPPLRYRMIVWIELSIRCSGSNGVASADLPLLIAAGLEAAAAGLGAAAAGLEAAGAGAGAEVEVE